MHTIAGSPKQGCGPAPSTRIFRWSRVCLACETTDSRSSSYHEELEAAEGPLAALRFIVPLLRSLDGHVREVDDWDTRHGEATNNDEERASRTESDRAVGPSGERDIQRAHVQRLSWSSRAVLYRAPEKRANPDR